MHIERDVMLLPSSDRLAGSRIMQIPADHVLSYITRNAFPFVRNEGLFLIDNDNPGPPEVSLFRDAQSAVQNSLFCTLI